MSTVFEASWDQLKAAEAEIERLRAALAIMWHAYDTDNRPPHGTVKIAKECYDRIHQVRMNIAGQAAEAEIERLRAALRQIIAEADSDDGMTAWDGADIARKALGPRPDGTLYGSRSDKR